MKFRLGSGAWYLRAFILGFIIYFFYIKETLVGAFLLGAFLVLLIFVKYEKHSRSIYILDFTLLGLFLFHIFGILWFYETLYYDDILHFLGGLLIGATVFLFLKDLNNSGRIRVPLYLAGVFAVAIAVFAGVVWELIEFLWDVFLAGAGEIAQPGLTDTMKDLIYDFLGSVIGVLALLFVNRNYVR
tara:strand:+ start:686 stop:1243 length:558 start_codon:yes stop_codon:yes gene_type:complete